MDKDKTTTLNNLIETKALVEQHLHGGFGIDFAVCKDKDFIDFSKKILKFGVCGFYPTLATDSIDNLKKQIVEIKSAIKMQNSDDSPMAKIIGVHLEACFLNPDKKGIHNEKQLLKPTVKNYKQIEDEIIKIVTLAPELDENFELCNYLKNKGIVVSAGHCTGNNLSHVQQVTHLYNAMGEFSHKKTSTVTEALSNDEIYTELIADCVHVQKDVLKITFKTKPSDKIILISDALPITHSEQDSMLFCGKKVFLKNGKAVDENGTMAGSTTFVSDIIRKIVTENLIDFETAVKMASSNIINAPKINSSIFWDKELYIKAIKINEDIIAF